MMIYKIFRAAEWASFETHGQTEGSPVDVEDGFLHFSTAEQLPETAAKHFPDDEGLMLAAVDTDKLGDDLKWEPSRGGALFPHLYRKLERTEVAWRKPLPIGPSGHVFPLELG